MNPSRSPWKLKAMRKRCRRGPHSVCYRCDSLEVDATGRCLYCEERDMVASCHWAICAACVGARKPRRAA